MLTLLLWVISNLRFLMSVWPIKIEMQSRSIQRLSKVYTSTTKEGWTWSNQQLLFLFIFQCVLQYKFTRCLSTYRGIAWFIQEKLSMGRSIKGKLSKQHGWWLQTAKIIQNLWALFVGFLSSSSHGGCGHLDGLWCRCPIDRDTLSRWLFCLTPCACGCFHDIVACRGVQILLRLGMMDKHGHHPNQKNITVFLCSEHLNAVDVCLPLGFMYACTLLMVHVFSGQPRL